MRAPALFAAITISAIAIAPSGTQGAWFMKIAAIQGASKDPAHSGWIDLQSFTWKTSSIGGALAWARSTAPDNITVVPCSRTTDSGTAIAVKRLDESSQKLSQALVRGTPLGNIEVQETDASGAALLDANLSDALVSANATTVEGDVPEETISFVYGRLKLDYHNRDCATGLERSKANPTGAHAATALMQGAH